MLNYKIERFLFVIVWFLLIFFFSIFLPPKTISPLIQYQYVASSFVLALLIFFLYEKISNKITLKRINNIITSGDIELALSYVSKSIAKQPKYSWLKVKKLELLILNGNICDYQAYRTDFSCKKKTLKSVVSMLDIIFSFLKQDAIDKSRFETINSYESILYKTYYLLYNRENLEGKELVLLCSQIFKSNIKLYRCIASVVLSQYYKQINDITNEELYLKQSIANSPSKEIEYCIEKIVSVNQL